MPRGREPELILPHNMQQGFSSQGWKTPVRYARRAVQGVVNAIGELPSHARVGIVGLDEIMRVADAELLKRSLPATQFVDVTMDFEQLRAQKSAEELAGRARVDLHRRALLRAAARDRPAGDHRARDRRRDVPAGHVPARRRGPAVSEHERVRRGRRHRRARSGTRRATASCRCGDQFVFSFELIGPLGYWMEVRQSRRVRHADRRPESASTVPPPRACTPRPSGWCPARRRPPSSAGCSTRSRAMTPCSAYWSGHGLGQDVIEEPWIGRETVDADEPVDWTLTKRMVLAMHPMVLDRERRGIAYLSSRLHRHGRRRPGRLPVPSTSRRALIPKPPIPSLRRVLQRRVVAASREMATVLMRSSRSPPIFNEIGDLVTVVFDRAGRTLAQTEYASIIANGAGRRWRHHRVVRRRPRRRRRHPPQRRLQRRQPERRRRRLRADLPRGRAASRGRRARATSPTSAA